MEEKIKGERRFNIFKGEVEREFKKQKSIEKFGEELIEKSHEEKENKEKYQEILFTLANLYCQGYELEWNKLYEANKSMIEDPNLIYPYQLLKILR